MDEGNDFAVLVKNLSTRAGEKCEASALVNLNDKFEYWPFEPKHKKDYQRFNEYGMIKEDKMVRCYILHISDCMNDLNSEVDNLKRNGRLPNPKRRYSLTPTEEPLKQYKLATEKKSVKNQKASQSAASSKAKVSNAQDILVQNKKHMNRIKNRSETPQVNFQGASSKEKENEHQDSEVSSLVKDHLIMEAEAQECLKCKSLTQQLDLACSESESWRVKYDDLLQKHDNVVKQHEVLKAEKAKDIESIKASVQQLPGIIKDLKENNLDCYLKNFHYAVKVDRNLEDFQMGEDEVHIGSGKKISHESLYEVGEITTQSQRVLHLPQLFWPDEVHLRSLSGKSKYKDLKMVKITDLEKKAMKNILNHLPGDDKVDLKGVTALLKNVTNVVRSKRFGSAGIIRKAAPKRKKPMSKKNEENDSSEEETSTEDSDKELKDLNMSARIKKARPHKQRARKAFQLLDNSSSQAKLTENHKDKPVAEQVKSDGGKTDSIQDKVPNHTPYSEDIFAGYSEDMIANANKNRYSEDIFAGYSNNAQSLDLDKSIEFSANDSGSLKEKSGSETDFNPDSE